MTKRRRLAALLADDRTILAAYLLLAVGACLQALLASRGGAAYATYNNFQIFRCSFWHLVHGQDLYVLYPGEHVDLFKYSPTFALLFAPFALLPVLPAMLAWNALNATVLFLGLSRFPHLGGRARTVGLWMIALEQWGALQHFQTNALIAGLILLAYGALVRGQEVRGSAAILLCGFIKVFGVVAFPLYAFAPRKVRLSAVTASVLAALAALPLLVVSPAHLVELYRSWFALLRSDHGISLGYSMMGWLQTWFGLAPDKLLVVALGAALMALPFLRRDRLADPTHRSLTVAALLIWMVIFNHRAEGPTFVIAMAGVVVWYGAGARTRGDTVLLALAFVFVSLSPTEVFPRWFRIGVVQHYAVKAVPCILIWARCMGELLLRRAAAPDRPAAAPGCGAALR